MHDIAMLNYPPPGELPREDEPKITQWQPSLNCGSAAPSPGAKFMDAKW